MGYCVMLVLPSLELDVEYPLPDGQARQLLYFLDIQFVGLLIDHLQSFERDILQFRLRFVGEILVVHIVQMFEFILELLQKDWLLLLPQLLQLLVRLLLAQAFAQLHSHPYILILGCFYYRNAMLEMKFTMNSNKSIDRHLSI